ncbi:expressed unknown protein [Seminavis robusta]|uniref:Uncharacterized protein n=1 Tax=Seminavis robusta TaxID=568900 RepID=A0A9N8EAN3_9STRA|nr:expressed unknown protein [Seminavis robusta]|eukprot:Sro892_g216940.1 n/a (487) ;mRNA; r:16216-17676
MARGLSPVRTTGTAAPVLRSSSPKPNLPSPKTSSKPSWASGKPKLKATARGEAVKKSMDIGSQTRPEGYKPFVPKPFEDMKPEELKEWKQKRSEQEQLAKQSKLVPSVVEESGKETTSSKAVVSSPESKVELKAAPINVGSVAMSETKVPALRSSSPKPKLPSPRTASSTPSWATGKPKLKATARGEAVKKSMDIGSQTRPEGYKPFVPKPFEDMKPKELEEWKQNRSEQQEQLAMQNQSNKVVSSSSPETKVVSKAGNVGSVATSVTEATVSSRESETLASSTRAASNLGRPKRLDRNRGGGEAKEADRDDRNTPRLATRDETLNLEFPSSLSAANMAQLTQMAVDLRGRFLDSIKTVSVVVPPDMAIDTPAQQSNVSDVFAAIGELTRLQDLTIESNRSLSNSTCRNSIATSVVTATLQSIATQFQREKDRYGLVSVRIQNVCLMDDQADLVDFFDALGTINEIPTLKQAQVDVEFTSFRRVKY